MRFTSEQRLDDGVLEREFTLGEVPGVLWTPGSAPAPLILIGHNGGLHKRLPRLVARARHYAAEYGFAAAAIDAPGHGDRPGSAVDEQHRAAAGASINRIAVTDATRCKQPRAPQVKALPVPALRVRACGQPGSAGGGAAAHSDVAAASSSAFGVLTGKVMGAATEPHIRNNLAELPLSLTDPAVDPFPQQVGVAAVAGVLLNHVHQY